MLGGIAQSQTEPIRRGVQAALKIHHQIARPHPLSQFVAAYYFAGPLQQGLQQLNGLALQLDLHAVLPEFARVFF
jgi:hypothetical protein